MPPARRSFRQFSLAVLVMVSTSPTPVGRTGQYEGVGCLGCVCDKVWRWVGEETYSRYVTVVFSWSRFVPRQPQPRIPNAARVVFTDILILV